MCLGVPGKIVEVKGVEAIVDVWGVRRKIRLDLVENIKKGDFVVVHAGFAIQKISEEEAREYIELIKEVDKLLASDKSL